MPSGPSYSATLRSGLTAYSTMHAGLASVSNGVIQHAAAAEAEAVRTLPQAGGGIPLSVLASVGHHLQQGRLAFLHDLRIVPERRLDGVPDMLAWHRAHIDVLQSYVPELVAPEPLWSRWDPPHSELPFDADRTSWRALRRSTSSFARVSFGTSQSPTAVKHPAVLLYVLLRDWFADLVPLLRELDVDGDALISIARETLIANASDEISDGVLKAGPVTVEDVMQRERDVAGQLGLTISAWTMLAGFALDDGPLTLLYPWLGQERIVGAINGLVERMAFAPLGFGAEPEPAQDGFRPSTTITSDAWTTRDELQYELYADAITRFILDERTCAPLTIGIKAPWGAGKTSLMRMVRKRLDPRGATPLEVTMAPEGPEPLSNGEVLAKTKLSPERAGQALNIKPLTTNAKRTTVWFNAWKYQSGEQMWAGLAHAIVSQVEQRMSRAEREHFWASLNIRRIDMNVIRRRIYAAFALFAIRDLVALPLIGIAAALGWAVSAAAGHGLLAVGLAGAAGDAAMRWREFVKRDVAGSDPRLVADPGYTDRLGFLHLVHEDMERILALVASPEQPLVVFIDDLDRCSYTTVVQVIEALNSFLAGDFENCLFVIAMEPDLVAAQIHVAYGPLFERIAQRNGKGSEDDLGWRFLEKMVQLPLTLPPPDGSQIERYVDSLVVLRRRAATMHADDSWQVLQARERIRSEREDSSLEGIEQAMERAKESIPAPATEDAAHRDAIFQQAARIEYASEFDDSHPDVREMLRRYAAQIGTNPREVKRFVNVFRFYAYVQFWRRTAGLPAPDLAGTAKLATLAVRCPQLLGALGTMVRWQGQERCVLECLERSSTEVGLDPELRKLLPEPLLKALEDTPTLGAMLRSGTAVGAHAVGFL